MARATRTALRGNLHGFIHASLMSKLAAFVPLLMVVALTLGLVGCGGGAPAATGDTQGELPPGTTDQPAPGGGAEGGSGGTEGDAPANPFESSLFEKGTEHSAALVALFPPPGHANILQTVDEPGDYEWYIDGTFAEIRSYIIDIYEAEGIVDLTPSYMREMEALGGLTAESMGLEPGPGVAAVMDTGWTLYGSYDGFYFMLTIQDASGLDDNYDYHDRVLVYMLYSK